MLADQDGHGARRAEVRKQHTKNQCREYRPSSPEEARFPRFCPFFYLLSSSLFALLW